MLVGRDGGRGVVLLLWGNWTLPSAHRARGPTPHEGCIPLLRWPMGELREAWRKAGGHYGIQHLRRASRNSPTVKEGYIPHEGVGLRAPPVTGMRDTCRR